MVNGCRYYRALVSIACLPLLPFTHARSESINADSLNSNFLQLGRRSGGRPQRTVYPRRLPVNTVIHTTLAVFEPTTLRLLVRRATSSATDRLTNHARTCECGLATDKDDSPKFKLQAIDGLRRWKTEASTRIAEKKKKKMTLKGYSKVGLSPSSCFSLFVSYSPLFILLPLYRNCTVVVLGLGLETRFSNVLVLVFWLIFGHKISVSK